MCSAVMSVGESTLIHTILLVVIGVAGCDYLDNECDSCDGPWMFPFNAESVMHTIIREDAFAITFDRAVLSNASLKPFERSKQVEKFFGTYYNEAGPNWKELYYNATLLVNFEKSKYMTTLCSSCPHYFHLMKIVDDVTLTERNRCKSLRVMFCDMPADELNTIRQLPFYRYVVKRDAAPPTFYAMFHTNAFRNFTKMWRPFHKKMDMAMFYSNDYYESIHDEYLQWVGSLRNEIAETMAMLQWHVYTARNKVRITCDYCKQPWPKAPWTFPFSAERVVHNYIESDLVAHAYEREILSERSLSADLRKRLTYRFLQAHNQSGLVKKIYEHALVLTREEFFYYNRFFLSEAFGNKFERFKLFVDISLNTTLSESQICLSNSLFLCSLEHSLFDAFINEAIPYTYRIERDVYVPAIHEATERICNRHTLANSYANVPIKQLLVNIVKNGGSGEIRTMERPFMSMIGEIDYSCRDMAFFLWYTYKTNELRKGRPWGRHPTSVITACVSCDWPFRVGFTPESILHAILPHYMAADFNKSVLSVYSLSAEQSVLETNMFLTRYEAFELKELYEKIIVIFNFETDAHERIWHFDTDYFTFYALYNISRAKLTSYAEKCERIERYACQLTTKSLHNIIQYKNYNYYAERHVHLPSYDDLLTTYSFLQMSKKEHHKAQLFLYTFTYLPRQYFNRFGDTYLQWAKELPFKEAQAMALIDWRIHYQKCFDVLRTINSTKKVTGSTIKPGKYYSCTQWMNFPINAMDITGILIEPFDTRFEYQCIVGNADLTKADRLEAAQNLLTKAGGIYLEFLKNITDIQEHEQISFYNFIASQVKDDAKKAMLLIKNLIFNMTLTDEDTCVLIEEYTSKMNSSTKKSLYANQYPYQNLWNLQHITKSFTFRSMTKSVLEKQTKNISELIHLDVSLPQLRATYFEWVEQLKPYAMAQKLAIIFWNMYEIRLEQRNMINLRIMHNRKQLYPRIFDLYDTFIRSFTSTDPEEQSMKISEVGRAVRDELRAEDIAYNPNLTLI